MKIDKGIPIPENHGERKTQRREILDSMEIGDSFEYSVDPFKLNHAAVFCNYWNQRGFKLKAGLHNGRPRVWRIG